MTTNFSFYGWYDYITQSPLRWDDLVGEVSLENDNDPIYEHVLEFEENVDNDADLEDFVVEDDAIFFFQILRRRLMLKMLTTIRG